MPIMQGGQKKGNLVLVAIISWCTYLHRYFYISGEKNHFYHVTYNLYFTNMCTQK